MIAELKRDLQEYEKLTNLLWALREAARRYGAHVSLAVAIGKVNQDLECVKRELWGVRRW